MDIPSHKIHNVLRVFTRRLMRFKKAVPEKPVSDYQSDLADEKRDAVIDRISERIISEARNMAVTPDRVRESAPTWRLNTSRRIDLRRGDFKYTVQRGNEQRTQTLSLRDTDPEMTVPDDDR